MQEPHLLQTALMTASGTLAAAVAFMFQQFHKQTEARLANLEKRSAECEVDRNRLQKELLEVERKAYQTVMAEVIKLREEAADNGSV